jgi:hypothetical protein
MPGARGSDLRRAAGAAKPSRADVPRPASEEARAICKAIGNRPGDANCLWGLADVFLRKGDLLTASTGFQQAPEI